MAMTSIGPMMSVVSVVPIGLHGPRVLNSSSSVMTIDRLT